MYQWDATGQEKLKDIIPHRRATQNEKKWLFWIYPCANVCFIFHTTNARKYALLTKWKKKTFIKAMIYTLIYLYVRGSSHGPLTRYVKVRVAHTCIGNAGTFSPPPRVSVTHVPWCMPESLTSGFLWSRWLEKFSRHFRCMYNMQFGVSGKRPIIGGILLEYMRYIMVDFRYRAFFFL